MNQAKSHCRILLAEDNPADVTLVREALKEHQIGCSLEVVTDGAQALNFIDKIDRGLSHGLDLLLLDMHLPKHDGADILRRLRATVCCAATPVIAMTASFSPYDEELAQKYAVAHYFRKPSTLDQYLRLGSVVANVLNGRTE